MIDIIKVEINDDIGWQPKHIDDVYDMDEIVRHYYEHIGNVAYRYADANGEEHLPPTEDIREELTEVSVNANTVIVSWNSDKYGEYDSITLVFPVQYLWEDGWEEELRQKRIEDNIAAVKKRKDREKQKQMEIEAGEYKLYLDLKERFEVLDEEATSKLLAKKLVEDIKDVDF